MFVFGCYCLRNKADLVFFLSLLFSFLGDPLFIQFRHFQKQLRKLLLIVRGRILEKGLGQEFEKRFDWQLDEAVYKRRGFSLGGILN